MPNVKLVLTFEKRELLFLNLVFRDDDENFVLPVSCFATRKRIFPLNLGLLDENFLEISLLLVFGTEIFHNNLLISLSLSNNNNMLIFIFQTTTGI